MFLPIRTDRRLNKRPWVNYTLIGLNVVIFLLTRAQVEALGQLASHNVFITYDALVHKFPVYGFYLNPRHFQWYQLITYQFLHAGWMHIIGNMIFLYVFGNGVEDRLGKIGYLAFYLIGGIIAGFGHMLFVTSPVLGASGSIAAVTGAYLALFPLSKVTIIWLLFIITFFEISSIYLILAEVGLNLFYQLSGGGQVAYLAHLSGYLYGFIIGISLLLTGILKREPYDILTLIEQRRRRDKFKRMAKGGYQPWESQVGFNKKSGKKSSPPPKPTAEEQKIIDLRQQISQLVIARDLSQAASKYCQLLDADPNSTVSEHAQLEIANQLMSESKYDLATKAYELFLKTYKSNSQRYHVQLILGLIYTRYTNNKQRASELLKTAKENLDSGDLELCNQLLSEM